MRAEPIGTKVVLSITTDKRPSWVGKGQRRLASGQVAGAHHEGGHFVCHAKGVGPRCVLERPFWPQSGDWLEESKGEAGR